MKDAVNRAFRGIWIPAEIWVSDLTPFEKLLLSEIDSLNNTENGCFASNQYFAVFLNLSESRIAHILSDLKKKGLVYQSFFDGRNRGLKIDITKLGCQIQQSMSDSTKEGCQIQQGTLVNSDFTPIYSKDYILSPKKRFEKIKTQQAYEFVVPSLNQIEEEFKTKLEDSIAITEAKKFFDHYDSVGWVVGKNATPMKNWHSAISQWISRSREWEKVKEPKPVTTAANGFNVKSFLDQIPS